MESWKLKQKRTFLYKTKHDRGSAGLKYFFQISFHPLCLRASVPPLCSGPKVGRKSFISWFNHIFSFFAVLNLHGMYSAKYLPIDLSRIYWSEINVDKNIRRHGSKPPPRRFHVFFNIVMYYYTEIELQIPIMYIHGLSSSETWHTFSVASFQLFEIQTIHT